jgi:uncharacterized membrane protein YgcG
MSLQRLDMKFGMVPRHSRYLSDRSGRLELGEMEGLRESLRLFEKKFPQVLLSVFVAELAAGGSASEFAFWLANRARFSSVEKTTSDNFDLLLVVDVTTKTAALTTGYGLEKHVPEDELLEALHAGERWFREGELTKGIQACIDFLSRRFRKLAANARKAEAEMLADAEKLEAATK